MDYTNHNTTLRTNKHLNFEERFYLEKRIVLGDSITAISRALGRSRTTIYTELKRGTVIQIRQGKSQLVYLADSGQATYERQRVGSFNTMRVGAIEAFINWIENDHKLALDVLHFVSNNMYKQAVKTGEVLAYPAICTLINYLINVFESENKKEVFIEKTREEIGSILGFSVRTINRNLKVLKEENLLSVSRKGILITQKQCEKLYEKLNSIK